MKLLSERLPGLLKRFKEELIDLGALAVCALAAPLLGFPAPGLVAATAAMVLLLVPAKLSDRSPLRQLLRRLPLQLGAAAVAAAVNRFFLSGPPSALVELGLWIALAAIVRVVVALQPQLKAYLTAADRTLRRALGAHAFLAVSGGLWIAGASALAGRLNPELHFGAWTPWALAGTWFLLDRVPWRRWASADSVRARLGRLAVRILVWLGLGSAGLVAATGATFPALLGGLLAAGVSLLFFVGVSARNPDDRAENFRRLCVAAFGFWLMYPLAYDIPLGAGDSAWYAATVGDVIAQFRAGVFPIFVGQSPYQFNGSIFPVRFAPLLHHLAYLADVLTLRSLGPAALLNLVLIACGIGAGFTAYAALRQATSGRAWPAAFLACLYLACPGVLGVLYNSDLYMTWTTVPVLPLALWGTLRTFERPDRPGPILLLVGAIGLLWWGHSPIALWTTLLLGASQVVRLWIQRRRSRAWILALVAAGLFTVLVAYPVISVLVVTPEKTGDNTSYAVADAVEIARFVKQAFPGALLPLSANGRAPLSDLQLGWSLWAGLLLSGVGAIWVRRAELIAFWLFAAVLLLLMQPIPDLNLALWTHVPAAIRNPTGNWAMGRLYLIAAVFTVFAMGLALSRVRRTWLAVFFLAAGLIWSGREAEKFLFGTRVNRFTAETKPSPVRLENLPLTRYSYISFKRPPYFSHGVVDPYLEERLLGPDGAVVAGNYQALEAPSLAPGVTLLGEGTLSGTPDEAPRSWRLAPTFRVEPGKRYALQIHFLNPAAPGVLVLRSEQLLRVYGLPTYGEPKSFGAAPGATNVISLFTTAPQAQTVTLTYFADPSLGSQRFDRYATYRWIQYDPASLPVAVKNWIPYEARVSAPVASVLETPRLFQRGYRAVVDGKPVPVKKTAAGLVGVDVPQGASEVVVSYRPPALLLASYVVSALGFCGIAALGGWSAWKRREADPTASA